MSRRASARSVRRRAKASTAAGPAASASVDRSTVVSTDEEAAGLCVTHWFDSGPDGAPYSAVVRFTGHRTDVRGKASAGDSFTREERIDRVVSGSGPVSVTTWVYGLNAGEWTVTGALVRMPQGAAAQLVRRSTEGGQTLPRATWSWVRWRVRSAPFAPVTTRWAPLVRLSPVPAVIHGSWTIMVTLGIVLGFFALLALLSREGIGFGSVLVVTLAAVIGGIVGGKLWYALIRPTRWRESLTEGWSVDGSMLGGAVLGIATLLVLGLPVGSFLDAGAVAFFVGVGVGRLGCFFTGCCAGRCTASRWGIWSSDRRIGARRIPTQLLESALGLTLAVVAGGLILVGPPVHGLVFVVGAALYVGARQFLLRLRADARRSSVSVGA